MNKLKGFFKTTIGKASLIGLGVLFVLIILIHLLGSGQNGAEVANQMQNHRNGGVKVNESYNDQEMLSSVTGEQSNMQQTLATLRGKVKKMNSGDKKAMEAAISPLISKLNASMAKQKKMEEAFAKQAKVNQARIVALSHKATKISARGGYPVNGAEGSHSTKLVWLQDQSTKGQAILAAKSQATNSNSNIALPSNGSILHPNGSQNTDNQSFGQPQKPKVIPAYTIPSNTILTGVTPDTPLIGMIMQNGQVMNAQSVEFQLGQNNLAANFTRLPAGLKGVQGSALCQGIFVWFTDSYVSCRIKSLTFIFKDGRIATNNSKTTAGFGYLTMHHGSSFIPGAYHGNALYAGAGTGIFSALQGWGNAFAAAQQHTSTNGSTTTTSYKSIDKVGIGAGAGAGAMGQAMNEWWQRLLKSTTDFVYVPNWNPKTHQILQLNAVITNPVDINYNPEGRKVSYENFNNSTVNNSLN